MQDCLFVSKTIKKMYYVGIAWYLLYLSKINCYKDTNKQYEVAGYSA